MSTSTLLNFKTLGIESGRGVDGAGGYEATFDDVSRFIRASKPRAYRELLREYSSGSLPLFGAPEDDAGLLDFREQLQDPTTVDDCRNMATLLERGLLLCGIADTGGADYDELEEAGLVLDEKRGEEDQTFLVIELEPSPETRRFLLSGLSALQPGLEQVCVHDADDKLGLAIVGDFLGLCENNACLMCNVMLDRLTDIMTHDISVRIRRRDSVATAHSMASSLWLAMLAGSLEGRVGKCVVCGKPYVAKKERGQKRQTCGDACRKKLSRLRAGHNARRG